MAYTQAQLTTFFTNAGVGTAPTAAQSLALQALATQNAAGQINDVQALESAIALGANSTTAVGVQTYAFFTGQAPSAAGLKALNAAYAPTGVQVNLNAENRFIAQSVALATQNEAAKTAFTASYGALSVVDATKAAYNIIIGAPAAAAAGVNVDNAVAYLTRAENVTYLTNFIKANTNLTAAADIDLAVKAAIIGQIMQAGTSYNNGAGLGAYASATDALLADLAPDGALSAPLNATGGIDLFTSYPGNSGGQNGGTTALTTNIDAFNGTGANETIVGDGTTVQAADQIDGGGGFDTLKIYAGSGNVPALKNVEAVYLVGNGTAYDFSGTTGLQQVWLENNQTVATTITLGAGVTAGVLNATDNTKAITFATTATATSASAVLSKTTDGGALILNGAAVTTVNLQSTGGSTNKVVSLASTGTEATLNVTGDSNLTITNALETSVKTISAGSFSGGLNVTLGVTTAATSVTSGSGKDTLDVSAVTQKLTLNAGAGDDLVKLGAVGFGADSTIVGGEGTDTVQITNGGNLNDTTGKAITGFEVLGTGTGTGTYDVTKIAGITAVKVDGDLAGNTTISNLTTQTASITAAQTGNESLTFALKDATGTADSLTITLGGGSADVTAVGGTGGVITNAIETVTLNSVTNSAGTASGFNSISKLDVTGAKTLNITGDYALRILDVANDAAITKVDASANTKGVQLDAFVGTQSVLYIGGAGADTFTGRASGGATGDTFKGGAGADTINLAAANTVSDVVIYSAKTDSVLSVSAALVASGFDAIANFEVGTDKIDLSTFDFNGFAAGVKNAGALANITTTSITDFFDVAGQDRGVAFGTNGTNTYLLVDVNKDGNFNAADDLFVQLTGTVTLSASDFIFG